DLQLSEIFMCVPLFYWSVWYNILLHIFVCIITYIQTLSHTLVLPPHLTHTHTHTHTQEVPLRFYTKGRQPCFWGRQEGQRGVSTARGALWDAHTWGLW